MWQVTAFLVGFAGSVHCIGMCGPIVLALPGSRDKGINLVFNRLLYNLGRVLSYGFIGGIIGLVGQGLFLAGTQQWVSILTGALLIVSVIVPGSVSNRVQSYGIFYRINAFIKKNLSRLLNDHASKSMLFIGILNGFLPCGLVYVALAGALNTGDAFSSVLYMVLFGLGTLPVMFAISVFGKFISAPARRTINRVIPIFIFLLGVLFILRGMNLGIKFISPVLKHKATTEQINICH